MAGLIPVLPVLTRVYGLSWADLHALPYLAVRSYLNDLERMSEQAR